MTAFEKLSFFKTGEKNKGYCVTADYTNSAIHFTCRLCQQYWPWRKRN